MIRRVFAAVRNWLVLVLRTVSMSSAAWIVQSQGARQGGYLRGIFQGSDRTKQRRYGFG